MRHHARAFRALSVAFLLWGCATPGPYVSEDVGALRAGLASTRRQAVADFATANELARRQAIERRASMPERILRQTDFPVPVSADAALQWNAAFGILDDYAAALQTLVDPAAARKTGDAVATLGERLRAPAIGVKVPSGLVAVFATLGEALRTSAAERKAQQVMRATDPAFQEVISSMATAIGQPGEPGSLAWTAASQWNNGILPGIENGFGHLDTKDAAGRRIVLRSYVDAMDARDRQISDLAGLQQSILAVGEAHRAAAQGRPGDTVFWIGRIDGWVDAASGRLKGMEGGKDQ